MWKVRLTAVLLLIFGLLVGYFVYASNPEPKAALLPVPSFIKKIPFKLGLDLSGGTHLIYRADVSLLKDIDISDSMNSLRDVIERRVNLFGVAEPVVQVQEERLGGLKENRLIVDLPGVTDVDQAVAMIGQTPLLEFKTENEDGTDFVSTPLTGRYLERAILEFDQTAYQPIVSLQFDKDGAELFRQITKENVGKLVAIYLDGAPISIPVVREEISGGLAQITGDFTPKEAKILVGRLNSGALPVPIELISTQTVGATLGEKAVADGVKAGLISFVILAIFFVLWYRLPGIIAILSLIIYIALMLALFKLIPVTLTAAGIAGFIISLGVAVDANILIFERIKEELRGGLKISDAVTTGFKRAWFSIRDANLTTLIAAIILFWFGTSSIQGFALVFGLGIIVSMLSAITLSRYFLRGVSFGNGKAMKFLFSSGISK
ncbi:protein-export membrane protein SecD [Candidatus Nomurabacteria bacterium RIFCSPLOWO2_01_FULL_42_20]|uniref:Protein translocase subunit SecD n=1 Tax=Candidatus Nomurabacteria bacterium RIFCSPHIGHO2_01_FULL_42_16 TaxID=1801743 RepID=A0A1F6VKA8_9BACT|nr:MAG: protein-export membrane protein SecD [Candidatus Nomurabacteria bacterium RIFCSPHIGHO2_01_FULL_42_16]OGI91769.1 MAG: protein-export membrane protein SecD [Candidatus Nomurabacteria bacterium RIFCSPLOWO2_01_FULL_42_20]